MQLDSFAALVGCRIIQCVFGEIQNGEVPRLQFFWFLEGEKARGDDRAGL